MGKIVKFFGYFLFFLAMVLFFLPKVQLYYLFEQEIQPYKLLVNQERVVDKGLSLAIEDAQIIYEGIHSADISSLDLEFLLFYNTIRAKDITLSSAAKSFVPLEVSSLKVAHLFYNPLQITLSVEGAFGEAQGSLDLLSRSFELHLKPSERMKKEFSHTLRHFKKEQNGEYSYAKNL